MKLKNYFKEITFKKVSIFLLIILVLFLIIIFAENWEILIESFKSGWNSR